MSHHHQWYAGFLNDWTQVTPAYPHREINDLAQQAALAWEATVTIRRTWSDRYQMPPTPKLDVASHDGERTRTYVIDGTEVTVDDPWLVLHQEPDPVIDQLVIQSW